MRPESAEGVDAKVVQIAALARERIEGVIFSTARVPRDHPSAYRARTLCNLAADEYERGLLDALQAAARAAEVVRPSASASRPGSAGSLGIRRSPGRASSEAVLRDLLDSWQKRLEQSGAILQAAFAAQALSEDGTPMGDEQSHDVIALSSLRALLANEVAWVIDRSRRMLLALTLRAELGVRLSRRLAHVDAMAARSALTYSDMEELVGVLADSRAGDGAVSAPGPASARPTSDAVDGRQAAAPTAIEVFTDGEPSLVTQWQRYAAAAGYGTTVATVAASGATATAVPTPSVDRSSSGAHEPAQYLPYLAAEMVEVQSALAARLIDPPLASRAEVLARLLEEVAAERPFAAEYRMMRLLLREHDKRSVTLYSPLTDQDQQAGLHPRAAVRARPLEPPSPAAPWTRLAGWAATDAPPPTHLPSLLPGLRLGHGAAHRGEACARGDDRQRRRARLGRGRRRAARRAAARRRRAERGIRAPRPQSATRRAPRP